MLRGKGPWPLSITLTAWITLVAALSFTALLLLVSAEHTQNKTVLRQATLVRAAGMVARELHEGRDPAALHIFARYPDAYAFRAFDPRQAGHQILAEANPKLLPNPEQPVPANSLADSDSLQQRFERFGPPGRPDEGRWVLTERETRSDNAHWVQVALTSDPAQLWRQVVSEEVYDHVLIPALITMPALILATLLAVGYTLRPLPRIAAQAEALGGAVAAGRPLIKLAEAGLPLEFHRVVVVLNAMLIKLDRSLHQQRQFAADAAHELRTPLSVLVLEVAQLPRCPATERIADDLSSLNELIGQMLRFAQAEAAMAGERRAVDVTRAARKACEDLAPQAARRGQAIDFNAGAKPAIASGQAALVDVAIRNIVDNALRYSPANSTVTVAVEAGPRVVVEDQGGGVPDAQKGLIFERCWRVDRSRTDGAGIGLALVYRIAQLHGGDVQVLDRPGGGARFVMTLTPWGRA